MSICIQLPQMTALPGALAHPYPLQISLQTREFIQGAVFHLVLMDTASGQRVRRAGAIQETEDVLNANRGRVLQSNNQGSRPCLGEFQRRARLRGHSGQEGWSRILSRASKRICGVRDDCSQVPAQARLIVSKRWIRGTTAPAKAARLCRAGPDPR